MNRELLDTLCEIYKKAGVFDEMPEENRGTRNQTPPKKTRAPKSPSTPINEPVISGAEKATTGLWASAKELVAKHPGKAIGIGAGVLAAGTLLGMSKNSESEDKDDEKKESKDHEKKESKKEEKKEHKFFKKPEK